MERFEQYIEFAPDAIVGVAGDGTIALANAQSVKVFGYTRGELIGQPVEMLVPERFRAMHDGHRGDFVTDPRTRAMGTGLELFGRRADGSEFPAEISLASIETEVGIIATAAIRDVSERLRAERKFEQFIEFAPDAIVGIEADGRIALVNGQTEKLFGYARDDLIGERVEKLIPGRFHERHEGHRSAYFGDPRTRPMGAGLELFGTRSDGTEFPCEISLSSIETERGPMATASIRDISDRVAAEQEREQLAAELAEQRRADGERERSVLQDEVNQLRRLESVGQLAGGVAHDFNNILGVVLNSAAFVAEELDPSSTAFEDVEAIRRAAERGTALTRQLLIFSRRDPARRQTIDLNDVIVDLEKLLQRALGEHVELATRLAKDLWAIEADIGQIEQVITNLAVNARDAMPRGGRLTVESANVLVDDRYLVEHPGTKLGRYVRLVVTDTGTGMSDDVTERAFEPFFTTKAKGEGTGLGLSTVYGIVFDAGGSIGLYSTPGVGTAVHVLLPVVDRKVETAASARVTRQRARGERVLLVEDETSVRRVARRILDKGGYHVVEASNGRDALELLDQAAAGFDLLLTDVIMPGMLGKELADTAVGRHPDLPVLFMSGYNDQILARDEDDGASPPFIEKPFNSETLLASVREVLDAGPA